MARNAPSAGAMPAATLPAGTRFDVLSDVHGCVDEFEDLLERLGWGRPSKRVGPWTPPPGRHMVIAGDLVDRGPRIVDMLQIAMAMVEAGSLSVTVGNHDDKLLRALRGHPVKVTHGLEASLEQLHGESARFRKSVERFLAALPTHLVLDDRRLVVAHAGLPEALWDRSGPRVRAFAMYGATTGGQDQYGFPIRIDWAADYTGKAHIVYGHTPVAEPVWRNRTIDIDTGCVFGHRLSAVRYPELEVVSVPARQQYQTKGSPFRIAGPGGPVAGDVPLAQAG